MKVLLITLWDDHRDGGGGQVTLKHLTEGLLKRGIEPVILSTKPGPGIEKTDRDGVRIWRVGLSNIYWPTTRGTSRSKLEKLVWHSIDGLNFGMQAKLKHIISVERPDVASVHQINGWSPLAWRTLASENIPTANVLHANESICINATMFKKDRNCSQQCSGCRILRLPHKGLASSLTAVVGVSKFILDRHTEAGYFHDVPLKRVIHNSRDPSTIGLPSSSKMRESDGITRFGFIGRVDRAKGVEQLLEAFTTASIPNSELLIAGVGLDAYVSAIRERWSSPSIKFLGQVRQSDFFPYIDVAIAPSLWNDTFPGVVFEALSFGKPVIGSRRGGIPEMIRDGVNGVLIEPTDLNAFIKAIESFSIDREALIRMSRAARESSLRFMDTDSWIEKYVSLYEEMIDLRTKKT